MFCMFCACLICFYLRATVSVVFYLAVLFRDVLLYCYYLHVYVLFLNKWYSRSSHRAIAIVGWSAINCASSSIHYRRVAHARTCLFKFLSLSLSMHAYCLRLCDANRVNAVDVLHLKTWVWHLEFCLYVKYLEINKRRNRFWYSGRHLRFMVKDLLPLNMAICSPAIFKNSARSASFFLHYWFFNVARCNFTVPGYRGSLETEPLDRWYTT